MDGVHADDVHDEQARVPAEASDRQRVFREIPSRPHGATLRWRVMRRLLTVIGCALLIACAPPPEREIVIGMSEYAFLPATIEVTAGERVRLVVRNVGRLEHDLVAGERGRALGLTAVHLAPGTTAGQDWTAPTAPSELRIVCSVPGHEALGMVALLIVRPRASPSPAYP